MWCRLLPSNSVPAILWRHQSVCQTPSISKCFIDERFTKELWSYTYMPSQVVFKHAERIS